MSASLTATESAERVRRRLRVRGQVQGVGFRPAVYRWAHTIGVSGSVGNDQHGVVIEVEGDHASVERFVDTLPDHLPKLAKIEAFLQSEVETRLDPDEGFVVATSQGGTNCDAAITVDLATCPACLREMRDAGDRRANHPFINCTDCGPRFSIVRAVPYDRCNTSMRGFEMCPVCRGEYQDPGDRRFHAQPVCCRDCGPRLRWVGPSADGPPRTDEAVLREAVRQLMKGRVLALKGIGGFHLAARATDSDAVRRLRQRKHRDAKPFALMVPSVEAATELVVLSDSGREALASPAAPIVLAPRRTLSAVAAEVAPGTHRLGVMLAYTPVHHRLFDLEPGLGPLVMTSGNLSDEPLVIDDEDAATRLHGIADATLGHDRPIVRGVDDSILLDVAGGDPVPLRRSRGMAPGEFDLGVHGPSTDGLCVGGELKATVSVVRAGRAVVGQHLGDLKHPAAFENFQRSAEDLLELFEVEPRWIACDAHPGYLSHGYAKAFAARRGIPLVPVQHHHAHAASLLAEHERDEPILAFVGDGVGYGEDGGVWGGELLLASRRSYHRLGHLRPLRLPGGDAAARDTRRCALALLYQSYGEAGLRHPVVDRLQLEPDERHVLAGMIRRNVNCAESSALGRVFDGVAALLGLCETNRFEAEAPMVLEAAASEAEPIETTAPLYQLQDETPAQLDLSELTRRVVDGRMCGEPVAVLTAMFQRGVAVGIAGLIGHAVATTGLRVAGLTGGVFANEALTLSLTAQLEERGLTVFRHRRVPPNDGGLSLGQAAVAVAQQTEEVSPCV